MLDPAAVGPADLPVIAVFLHLCGETLVSNPQGGVMEMPFALARHFAHLRDYFAHWAHERMEIGARHSQVW